MVSEPRETHSPLLKARFLHLTILAAAGIEPPTSRLPGQCVTTQPRLPDVTKMTKWIPARNILCEVKMESAGSHTVIEETSVEELKKKGFTWKIDHTNTEHSSEDMLTGEPDEEGFFEVQDVVNKKFCRQTHEELYEVKFSGYVSSQNMWLSGSTFKNPIQFETRSRSGRVIKQKTKTD